MLKKTIKFTDYNGVERTKECFFNFSEQEVVVMEMESEGGIQQYMQRIIDSNDPKAIINHFKEFILNAYGEKSDDGMYFIKFDKDGHRLADKFAQSAAFSKLYLELAFDANSASEFVNGVLPKKIDLPESVSQQN